MLGCGGLIIIVLDSRLNRPGSIPGWGHCIVFLGKTLNSRNASLHPDVKMGTDKIMLGGGGGGNPAMD